VQRALPEDAAAAHGGGWPAKRTTSSSATSSRCADAKTYAPTTFTGPEKLRLAAIFPDGVCDFSKPGVGQAALKGTWLRY
jgi:hypothetical protein